MRTLFYRSSCGTKCIAVMALSLCFWANYTKDSSKLRRKSESSVHSDRVLRFVYDEDNSHVEAVVQASMRDLSYAVKVCSLLGCD